MLKHRLIFGPIMIALLLGVIVLDDWLDQVAIEGTMLQTLFLGRTSLPAGLVLLVLFLVAIALGTRELAGIFRAKGIDADPVILALSAMVGCVLIYLIPHDMDSQGAMAVYATFLVGLFMLALVRHSWAGRTQGAVAVASVTLFALIYMGTLPGFYLAIRRWHSAWVVAAIILITKACDIGAYFTGRAFGRHKLIPWLSPGKTWEGLVGGVIFSALIAIGLAWIGNTFDLAGYIDRQAGERVARPLDYPLWFAGLAGLVIALVGQFGDLTASLFKRDAGLKDSGRSIPGFGGLLDVVDSPLAVAPVAYWLLQLAVWLGDPD